MTMAPNDGATATAADIIAGHDLTGKETIATAATRASATRRPRR